MFLSGITDGKLFPVPLSVLLLSPLGKQMASWLYKLSSRTLYLVETGELGEDLAVHTAGKWF